MGLQNKPLLMELHQSLGLGDDDVGRKDKVNTKVANTYRVLRDLKAMIETDESPVVARRLAKLVRMYTRKFGVCMPPRP
ncbi:hypothetical protein Q9L58_000070 [Maublancomyces gigas]|uniref:Uncharacterized protein n=1 Tax=Discina gigas TaxID=1032678 RepID=A0ABR3GY16_9PEZI